MGLLCLLYSGNGRDEYSSMKSLLDPTFKYVPSNNTDLKKTFELVRERQKQEAEAKAAKVCGKIEPKQARSK